ncbi:MAG: M20/M25/M40 family metallo-hydrolase, partial [Cyclobacteriaceae bacterium]
MRGRSALVPEDIDKAASFIEKEFKKAGLKPLNGSAGFRQEFQKVKIMLESIEVVAIDEVISSDKIIMSSTEESIEINTSSFDSIGKSQKLFPTLLALEKKAGDRVILVAKEHASDFQIAKNYLSQPKILDPGEAASGTKVYILGLDNPTNISVKAGQSKQNITMANIVGTLDGKSRPDENVIFSAHYDHIGIQAPIAGDSIANGADDDASGTTAVITLAKYFKKLNSNERTLIFVAFTAEEIGGFGSKYFSQQLNADQVVAMFNIEMIGKLSKWGSNAAFITGFERSDFGDILQENLEGTAVKIYPDPYPEQNLFYRSDNATLARLGVPAHSISTDQIPTDTLY